MKKELMTKAELEKEVSTLREKIRVINFAGAGSRPKNVKELNTFRKEIARFLTMKTELASSKK